MEIFYGNIQIAKKLDRVDKNRLQTWNQRQKSIMKYLENLMQNSMKKIVSRCYQCAEGELLAF